MSRFRHHLRSTGLASALAGVFTFAILSGEPAAAWPLDDSDDSRIGRLEYMRRIESGQLQGTKQPPGALLPTSAVRLRMLEHAAYEAGTPDTGLSAALRGLLGARAADYSVALLDLSNPERPYYAEHRAEKRYNPGSVGKFLLPTPCCKQLRTSTLMILLRAGSFSAIPESKQMASLSPTATLSGAGIANRKR